jgi:hypothetical protein
VANQVNDTWTVSEDDFPARGTPAEKLRFLVNYAVLAPSGHNTQPWLLRVAGDSLEVIADRTRALPVVDPEDRELTISCGAALETLEIAMRHFGHEPEVDTFPRVDDSDVLARVRLGEPCESDEEVDRLFRAITQRRTVRKRFDDRPVPDSVIEEFERLAGAYGIGLKIVADEAQRREVATLVSEGDRIQFADRRFRRELAAWIHSRRAASRDGISGAGFGMPDLLSPLGALVVRTFDIGGQVAAQDEQIAMGSPLLAIFHTESDDPRSWLDTGRALTSVLLASTAEGVRASYLNQPIEVAELRLRLAGVAEVRGTPQLLMRFGYGPTVEPAVRRPVDEVMI